VHQSFGDFSSCDHWKTFTLNSVSSSCSSYIGATIRFESIITSSAMIESSPTSTKTKRVVEKIWYLQSKEIDAFILKIRVGVVCNSDGKTSWKPWHPSSNVFVKPYFENEFKKYMEIFVIEILILIYYVLHN
jgi:hypothetical protein